MITKRNFAAALKEMMYDKAWQLRSKCPEYYMVSKRGTACACCQKWFGARLTSDGEPMTCPCFVHGEIEAGKMALDFIEKHYKEGRG